jgi:hypothetical protein
MLLETVLQGENIGRKKRIIRQTNPVRDHILNRFAKHILTSSHPIGKITEVKQN